LNGRAIAINADRPGADKTTSCSYPFGVYQIEFGGGAHRNAVADRFGCRTPAPGDGEAARADRFAAIAVVKPEADTE
jgi:hypothetical protein